jgi:hypothetical protein
MLKARATSFVLGIALVLLAAIGTASPARADRGFGFHHHPFFFHSPFFFHNRFFFGFPGIGFPAPYPAVTYYPPAYYAPPPYYPPPQGYPPPPPPPSYYQPGVTGAPPPSYPQVAEATPPSNYSPPQRATPGNCRKVQQSVILDGRSVMAYGTTCEQPDGSWRIIP